MTDIPARGRCLVRCPFVGEPVGGCDVHRAADGLSPWRLSGQWAYPVEKLHGMAFKGILVRGVADLCVLPDGSLLVLEREFSWDMVPCFRCGIYQVDLTTAISDR